MSFNNTYRPLFDIQLLHHYFLDDGNTHFDSNPTLTEKQLSTYSFKTFLSIIPAAETLQKSIGQKIILKETPNGLTLFIKAEETAPNSGLYKPFTPLFQNTTLTFLLYTNDALFENYSMVPSVPSIPFYFSNKKPSTEPNTFTYIDVMDSTTLVEAYTIHQSTFQNIETILSAQEKIGLFGIIQLEMQGDNTVPIDAHPRNILNVNGNLPAAGRSFKIQFKNRETIWNYRDAANSSLLHSSEPTLLPLVQNGIVGYSFGGKKRPAAAPTRLVFEKDNNGNILKTISEIYIN